MDIIALLNGLVIQLEALKLQIADAQGALEAEKKASYDQGFADGFASVEAGDPEKKFSQADLDQAVSAAIVSLKADLKAQYEAQQVAESESETGFKGLLE